jgi:hypothetical protein
MNGGMMMMMMMMSDNLDAFGRKLLLLNEGTPPAFS